MKIHKWFLDAIFFVICPLAAYLAPVTQSSFIAIVALTSLFLLWSCLRLMELLSPRIETGSIGEVIK